MEAGSDGRISGKACSKTVAAQKWAGYAMPDGLYYLCKPDTLVLRYSYLVFNGTTYDGYFAQCLNNNGYISDTLLSNRPVGQNFTAVPGHIDVYGNGHLISVTAYKGAEALRLRVDNFRVDWSGDKANSNYVWSASAW